MIKRYAIIANGKVDNICLWDGVTPWTPNAGTEVVEAPDNIGPGWLVDGEGFVPPPPPPPPEKVTLSRWLSALHTSPQRVAWSRAQEMSRQLAMGSPDLDGETAETLEALETVGEWFMVAQVTGEVTLADDAIYQAGLTLGVYASQSDVDRIKSDTAP